MNRKFGKVEREQILFIFFNIYKTPTGFLLREYDPDAVY